MRLNSSVPARAAVVAGLVGRALVAGAAVMSLGLACAPSAMAETVQQAASSGIASSIPDDATVIAPGYVQLDSGEVVDASTGEAVEDSSVVGTPDAPADPLDRTGGVSFVPLSVGQARSREGGASLLSALEGNGYGARWGSFNGNPAFLGSDGSVFAYQAKGVVDVSEHQGAIDWQAVKDAGVDGAIIRIAWGDGSTDLQAARNISECKRLGIPFGVYLYSYAENSAITGADEGNWAVSVLRKLGVSPSDLSYPVYYDLEHWAWTGHTPPTDPAVYESIVRGFVGRLNAAGYGNVGVYSYTNYLRGPLASDYIYGLTTWVAQYGGTMQFTGFKSSWRGWQYTSSGKVAGISGNADLNAFGDASPKFDQYNGQSLSSLGTRVTDIAEGDYTIKSSLVDSVVDIRNGSMADGAEAILWPRTGAANQVFHITPVGGGEYTIRSAASGKNLDVYQASSANGAAVIQWLPSGAANQRWTFWRTSDGTYLIAPVSALPDNKVIDLTSGSTAPGTALRLWAANGGGNQRFSLVPAEYGNSTFTVSFDSQGGSSVASQSVKGYRTASKPGDPTREGYEFAGWYTSPAGGSAYDFSSPVTSDVKLYAHWRGFTGWKADGDGYVWYEDGAKSTKGDREVFDPKTNGWYWLDPDSRMLRNRVQLNPSNGGKWCYYGADGKMAHGERYLSYDKEHTGWYYFDDVTGAMLHGDRWVASSGGKWVRYDFVTGKMVKGLQRYDGSWYYFDPITGAMAHGDAYVPDWGATHHFDQITGRG